MINYIVVEDNPLHRKRIEEIINKYMLENDSDYKIRSFEKRTTELDNYIKSENDNNIYVLDFELPNSNAIDISKYIRTVDWKSPIIVFTAHGGMALETFKQRLQILDFVNKQYEDEKNLFELFDICFEQLNLRKSLKYKYKGTDYNIEFDKIYYIYRETFERKTYIVTKNKKYMTNFGIKDLLKKLDNNFVVSHRACIINMNKVRALCWNEGKIVFIDDQEIYFLSKKNKKEILKHEHSI